MSQWIGLLACGKDGEDVESALAILSEDPSRNVVRVGRKVERQCSGPDLFYCLLSLRQYLESRGLLLCCQGARRNVSPSGMTRQMSSGRLAYLLKPGVELSDDDLIDVFMP